VAAVKRLPNYRLNHEVALALNVVIVIKKPKGVAITELQRGSVHELREIGLAAAVATPLPVFLSLQKTLLISFVLTAIRRRKAAENF